MYNSDLSLFCQSTILVLNVGDLIVLLFLFYFYLWLYFISDLEQDKQVY